MRTILLGACALVLLSACGKREPAADVPQANAPAVAAADTQSAAAADAADAAAAAAAAKLRDGYRARLVPLLAGSYAGSCQIARGSDPAHLIQGGAAAQQRIEIGADGKLAAAGVQRDLMHGTEMLMLDRTLEGGKAVSAVAVTGANEPAWTLTVQSGREDRIQLTGDTSAIDCGTLEHPLTLRDKALWPVVADFFSAGAATLACTQGGGVKHGNLAIKADGSGVDIGGRRFALDRGLLTEMTGLDKDKGLSYAADVENGIKLLLMLDQQGKLAQVITAGQPDDIYDCHREAAN
jgi:hypothetical protein